MKRLLLLLALAVLASCGSQSSTEGSQASHGSPAPSKEPEVLSDEWQLMRILGADSGYIHGRCVKRGDAVETVVESNLEMSRMGSGLKVAVTETCEERASDGSIVRMRSVQKMSEYVAETEVRFEGTKAILSKKVAGEVRVTEKECGEGLLGLRRIDELTRAMERKPGVRFEARTFMADLGGPVDLAITMGDEEEVELLDGRRERLRRVETHIKGTPLKPVAWLDASGRAIKTSINIAGLPMECFATTEERARKPRGTAPAPPPDVFDRTLLAPRHPIPFPRRLDRATYRIRPKEAGEEMPELADDRQATEKQEDGSMLLRIERKVPPDGRTGTRPIADPPADLAACVAANSMVQADAPEIATIARDAVGDERDAWKAAQKLERWVHDNITDKNMDVGFASALEVARNREGDCTEHAVLFCALCRAAGIPSRVAMGVICIGNAFGGHAWTEVWIDGIWYALDATLGQGSADPTHITLGRMTLEDNAGPEALLGLLQGLGSLEIDPVEVVLQGRTLRPGDPGNVRTDGRRYENRLWGIAFTCPEGFEFDPPGAKAGMTTRLMELDRTAKGSSCEIEIDVTDGALWDQVRASSASKYDSVEELTVDGRPAFRGANKGRRRVYALANGGLFLFELEPVEGDAEAKAFEELVASVDFDVK